MNFDQKLNTLMHLFKISNSKLARGIDVDASLVSRWKSGERKISPNSPHIPMLANYFLKLNAYHYQKEYLEHIILARLPAGQPADEPSRVHILADWLISAEPPDPQPDEQPEQLAQSMSLISNITDILSGPAPEKQAEAGAAPAFGTLSDSVVDYEVKPGSKHDFEVFEGRNGRRQAVLNLLDQVLRSDDKEELFITSEDDMRWLTEDRRFTEVWARLLRKVIEKGHQITMIHIVSRRVNEIMSMLSYWMPMHMAVRINSYYYPRFGDRRVRQTLMIVRGKIAVVSSTVADFTGNDLTYWYTDPVTIEQNLRIFMVHVSQCRPLFTLFNVDQIKGFFELGSEHNKKIGATNNIRHQLNIRLLPIETIKTYLTDDDLLHGLTVQQQEFNTRLEQESYIDILPLSLLDEIETNGTCLMACSDVFCEQPVRLNREDTVLWLKKTLAALQDSSNYELYLSSENAALESLRINITYKENTAAVFAPASSMKRPASILSLNEGNVLHSLSYFFDDIIQQIPASLRSRGEVCSRLERLITVLEGKLRH
jgi:hypothetical protein